MDIRIDVSGVTPLLMHNPQMVDPDFTISRQIKEITDKRKKTEEDRREIERLEWYGGLYVDAGKIVQPTSKLRKCIIEAARISRAGKQVERGLLFGELNTPLIYEGPRDIDQLWKAGVCVSKLPVGLSGRRVMRTRPMFLPWSMSVSGILLTEVMDIDDLVRSVELAGRAVGIGDNRINGYGRFSAEVRVD
jgi:hypothetical protein